jgi:hypothetical protein
VPTSSKSLSDMKGSPGIPSLQAKRSRTAAAEAFWIASLALATTDVES